MTQIKREGSDFMNELSVTEAILYQLHRFMPAEYCRHEITIENDVANVTSTYIEPLEYIYIEMEVK